MKHILALLVIALLGGSACAQEVTAKHGFAPPLPGAGKWIGSNKAVRLEDLKGKVLVVHFWKTEWDPCIQNFKVFASWLEKYSPEIRIIGIHGADTSTNPEFKDIEKVVLPFVKVFPTVVDDTDLTLTAWKVEQVPTTFLIDKKGMLRYAWEGQIAYKRIRGDVLLEKKIEDLLKEK